VLQHVSAALRALNDVVLPFAAPLGPRPDVRPVSCCQGKALERGSCFTMLPEHARGQPQPQDAGRGGLVWGDGWTPSAVRLQWVMAGRGGDVLVRMMACLVAETGREGGGA
jgi:hypothetical protein